MKSEGIGNKILLITMLCAALGLFLYLRPRLFAPQPQPSLEDRLPVSEIIGRFFLLDVAREANTLIYKQKLPFREYMTYDFLLSQGKNYGLDIQKPGYFFSDSKQEWGTFVTVTDSSKILNGLQRLSEYLSISDTIIFKRKVHKIDKMNTYLFYDKSYLFVYHGTKLKQRLGKSLFAKNGEIETNWKRFNAINTFKNEKLVVFSQSKRLKKYGIDYGLFAHDADSLSVKLKTFLHSNYDLKIKMKDPGLALVPSKVVSKSLNLHLNISEFKQDKKHPLYLWISDLGKVIGFPTSDFFAAWEGDLSFQEGGTQLIDEEVIEMGYDEEFNPVEVRKVTKVPVTGFSVVMSVNENSKAFMNRLFAKGIMTKQGQKYRFLFSPPLKLNMKPDMISVFTSNGLPQLTKGTSCNGIWNYKGTRIDFQIDSLTRRDVYGSLSFPVGKLVRKGNLKLPG